MKKPHAQWLTLHKADIDPCISIEILWQTELNTLNLLVFRIGRRGRRPHLTTEEIGPYHSLADLRQKLCRLFGELPARCICHNASSWLPRTAVMDPTPRRRGNEHRSLKKSSYEGYQPQGSPEIVAPNALPSVAQIEAKEKLATESLPAFGGQTELVRKVNGKSKPATDEKACQRQSTTA